MSTEAGKDILIKMEIPVDPDEICFADEMKSVLLPTKSDLVENKKALLSQCFFVFWEYVSFWNRGCCAKH